MKFHLRTLFGLITVTCILVALSMSIVNYRTRVREHRLTFLSLDDNVSLLDTRLRQHILHLPAVAEQLQEANPIDPEMALGQSVIGESRAFGTFEFTREFHYDWQLSSGSRCDGIKVTVDSVLKEESLDDHVVRLTYETSELNDQVASWIGEQLAQNAHVQVKHIMLMRKPPAVQEPASKQEDNPLEGWSVHAGVR